MARWIDVYRQYMLATGIYRGELCEIAFDKPEAYVVERPGRLYYAFYALRSEDPIELRGLGPGAHELRDVFADRMLGRVDASNVRFAGLLLVVTTPVRA